MTEAQQKLKDGDGECPFCGENEYGFDRIGLRDHLLRWCEVFNNPEL